MELKPGWMKNRYIVFSLLIVPYGIETIEVRAAVLCVALLIVPYGIETK